MRILAKRPLTAEEKADCLRGWLEKRGIYVDVMRGVPDDIADSEYSEWTLGGKTVFETIKRAYKIGSETLIAMSLPKRAILRLDAGRRKTVPDGVNIQVGTKVFEDKELEVSEQMDIFVGNVVHEGAHVKYADPKFKYETKLHRWVGKVLADEFVERQVFKDQPGFAGVLEKRRIHYFDKVYLEELKRIREEKSIKGVSKDGELEYEDGPLTKFLSILMKMIRYTGFVKDKELDELGDRLLTLKPILCPFPDTWEKVKDATNKIVELVKDLLSEELAEELKHDKEEEEPGVIVMVLSKEASEKLREMIEEAIEEELDDDSALAVLMTPGGAGEMETAVLLLTDKYAVPDVEGECEKADDMVAFFPEGDNKEEYMRSLNRVSRYIPAVAKELILRGMEMKYVERGHQNGKLDTNKLVEGRLGVPTIYIKEGMRQTSRMAVTALVDESGSMSGSSIESARDMAVLLNEVLGRVLNVDYFIYGHSGDQMMSGSTELYIYREPRYRYKWAIGSIAARSQNRDGVAIWNAAVRTRQFTHEPGIMFVLSDGLPCANGYSGNAGIEHTRHMVKMVQSRLNMQVIQIAINHSYDPKRMFDHYLILEDLGKLAWNVGKEVRKAILKNTVVHYNA